MNQRLLVTWAVGASVVAIAALSYIAGKQAGSTTSRAALPTATEALVTEPGGEARASVPTYAIPEKFADVPTQWRSPTNNAARGYVALFDPQRRELLVEQCAHPGYSVERARAGKFDMPFCEPVMRARLAALTDAGATALDQTGDPIEVRIDAQLQGVEPSLRLRFDGHDTTLQPGSKNDYFQALEGLPAIAAQKDQYMLAMMKQSTSAESERATNPAPATTDQ